MPENPLKGPCGVKREWVEMGVFEVCPVVSIPEYSSLFRARNWASDGILPNAGGWADQSYAFIRGVEIINEVLDRHNDNNKEE